MENSSAFLLVLNPDQLHVNEREICEYLYDIGYRDLQPITAFDRTLAEQDTHSGEHCLVVWRFNENDKLSDEKIFSLFGKNVHVEYRHRCTTCQTVKTKIEHVPKHDRDKEYLCDCIAEEEKV